MSTVKILSAGAAQAVVEKIAPAFMRETGHVIQAEFSAVGAMKARVLAGEPVDVVILSAQLIEELLVSGHLAAGSARDLGTVGTGVAVRAGAPLPGTGNEDALRCSLLAASRIVCPDPAVATAGKVMLRALEFLAITEQVLPRLKYFPNGYAAMRWLAASDESGALGITQITEIRANAGVTYAGPMPEALQMKTVYTAGRAAGAREPAAAGEFIDRLAARAQRPVLEAAGFEFPGAVSSEQ